MTAKESRVEVYTAKENDAVSRKILQIELRLNSVSWCQVQGALFIEVSDELKRQFAGNAFTKKQRVETLFV